MSSEAELQYLTVLFRNTADHVTSIDRELRATERFMFHLIKERQEQEEKFSKGEMDDGYYGGHVIPYIEYLRTRVGFVQQRMEETVGYKNYLQDQIDAVRSSIESEKENQDPKKAK